MYTIFTPTARIYFRLLAIGNPIYSLIVSVCRQLVVLIPAAWLLAQTGNLNMVWLAFPIAELMSLTMSSIFLRRTLRIADRVMAEPPEGLIL